MREVSLESRVGMREVSLESRVGMREVLLELSGIKAEAVRGWTIAYDG
jgi:hypothetical protein